MNLNRAQLLGNVTQDIETKTTSNGKVVASFSVATNRKWKTQEGEKRESTEFHNCVAWGNLADILKQYVHKGDKIYVEGHLQTRSWDDPTGVKKYRTEIVIENMIMLGTKRHAEEASNTEADDVGVNPEDIPF